MAIALDILLLVVFGLSIWQGHRQGFIKTVTDPQGFFCPFVSFFSHGTQAHLADSGVSGFTAGAVTGTGEENNIEDQTGRVHEFTNS